MMRLAAVLLLFTTATAAAGPRLRIDEPPGSTPSTPSATTAPPTSLPLTTAPATSLPATIMPPGATAPHAQPSTLEDADSPNFVVEVVVGGVFGVAGLFGGGVLGEKLDCASGCPGDLGGLGGALLGAGLGLTIATTAGVALVGRDDKHDVSIALTWLGTVVGGVAGTIAAARIASGNAAGAIAILTTSTALGGTLMLHASRTTRRPKTAIRLAPLTGGSVGLSLVGTTW